MSRRAMTSRAFVSTVASAAARFWKERSTLLVAVPFFVAVIGILTGVWRVAVEVNDGLLVGYTAAALTWYIAASEASMLAMNFRLIEDTGSAISNGSIAVELLRPSSVLGVRAASEFGSAIVKLACLGSAGALFCLMIVGAPPRPIALLVAIPSMLLAVGCNVAAQHIFAASAFWIRDTQVAWFLYQKLVFVLGGMLIPLEVFPEWLATTARWLPFSAMAYAPARFASGHLEWHLLGVQLLWLGVLAIGAHVVFRAGEQRLQVVGG